MGNLEWSLTAEELSSLSVICPKCRTEITFNMTKEFAEAVEIVCPRCGGLPMPGVKELLSGFREFYRSLKQHPAGSILFRLPAPKDRA